MNQEPESEIIEIEEYAREDKPVPTANSYRIRIDRQKYIVHKPTPTGKEILALAEKTPDKWKLYLHKRGHQPRLIEPDEVVDLREPGVERFTTMPRDTTEGLADPSLRREFQLPAEDVRALEALGLCWEAISEGSTLWLKIHDWKLPPGYNVAQTCVALMIPANYPDSQIDMVYFSPVLNRLDGRGIGALSPHTIEGTEWQRWSRHRTAENPWRPGTDDISTHLCLVDEWLRREFEK